MSGDLQQTYSIERFENAQIDPELFDHEAHVYVGWLYVREFGLAGAIDRFDRALKRLTKKIGVPDKYHATITWLYLMLIADGCRYNENWQAFRRRNQELIENTKATLSRYYSDALLFSNSARKRFVLPDKLPG